MVNVHRSHHLSALLLLFLAWSSSLEHRIRNVACARPTTADGANDVGENGEPSPKSESAEAESRQTPVRPEPLRVAADSEGAVLIRQRMQSPHRRQYAELTPDEQRFHSKLDRWMADLLLRDEPQSVSMFEECMARKVRPFMFRYLFFHAR